MAILRKDRFVEFVDITNGPGDTSKYETQRITAGKWQIAKLKTPPNSKPIFITGMYYVLYVGTVGKGEAVSAPNPPFNNDDSIG